MQFNNNTRELILKKIHNGISRFLPDVYRDNPIADIATLWITKRPLISCELGAGTNGDESCFFMGLQYTNQ